MNIQQGATLFIVGNFKVKSDLPAECMTYGFKNSAIIDYFSCE